MSERDPDSPTPPGEPVADHRVGDLIAGRVPEEELDPDTIARLAAWFGAPAPDAGEPEDPEMAEVAAVRQRALDAVDPAFLARLESREASVDALRWEPAPMTLNIERPISEFDLSSWRLRHAEIREYELPDDLPDWLKERTPQAVLRDLHRPVEVWSVMFRPRSFGLDFDGREARERMNQVMTTRYRASGRDHQLATRAALEGMAELRAQLAEPWEDSCVPEAERTEVTTMPTADDLKWFGSVGYDPDL